MRSIFRLCNEFNISLTKARQMDKDGLLNLDQSEEPEQEIFYWLSHGSHLTVRHMVMLIEKPSLLHELGSQERKARDQLEEVGSAKEESAPPHVVACIAERTLIPEAVALLVDWIRSVLPAHPVSHYWIATRLVFGLPKEIREDRSAYVRFALKQCRNHPDMAGWSRPENRYSRVATLYQRPERLYDL